ncbi:heme-degrading monooxygenase HmoA [Anoxybacillus tepidamans]|uniref:Heme-degrading monooxygenase HmoA n=1 Tax=Anoxybacteroides tepidamans TaxID=265948 RepID=A0A7W8ILX9_9BACL|nr:heme-degrading monooxygenase HmoA [Anoxybacillus tepidamans]
MKRLKITNDHGWTPQKLRQKERTMKNASLRQRVTAVRLVMEGYIAHHLIRDRKAKTNSYLWSSRPSFRIWRSERSQ